MAELIANNYRYNIELLYTNRINKVATKLRSEQIISIVIDKNYDEYNMPMIFVNISLDKRVIDDLVSNYQNHTMIIRIYKFIKDADINIQEKVLEEECVYFINENINYNASVDYPEGNDSENINKNISIGLMSLRLINKNKSLTLGTVLSGSMNDIVKSYTSGLNMVIEKFNYNPVLKQQIIQNVNSISELIKYLNSISVFYKTSYRFFMDFDRSYLVSSANKEIPAKGENISAVLICIKDIKTGINDIDGMYINKAQKNYQINIPAVSTKIYKNQILEKVYTAVSATTTSGSNLKTELAVNKSASSSAKSELIRIANDNKNMISNINSDISSSSAIITMEKNGIDSSVLNINKRYIIKNIPSYSELDGDYLLSRKVELYLIEDNSFVMNTMLTFRIKP